MLGLSLSLGSYLVASAWKMWSSAILIYIELWSFRLNSTKFDKVLLCKAEKVKKTTTLSLVRQLNKIIKNDFKILKKLSFADDNKSVMWSLNICSPLWHGSVLLAPQSRQPR